MVLFFFIRREIVERSTLVLFLYTLENSKIDTEVLFDFTRSNGDMCKKKHAQK